MVLSKTNHKSFTDAEAYSAEAVADGDALWLYIKFAGKVRDYAYRDRTRPGQPVEFKLFFEVGVPDQPNLEGAFVLTIPESDLLLSELKFALAPGRAAPERSLPFFLNSVTSEGQRFWRAEIRLSNRAGIPRMPGEHLATTAVDVDLTKSIEKYAKMFADYETAIVGSSRDVTKLPPPGRFSDAAVRNEILLSVFCG
jgi:hypothetical protein